MASTYRSIVVGTLVALILTGAIWFAYRYGDLNGGGQDIFSDQFRRKVENAPKIE